MNLLESHSGFISCDVFSATEPVNSSSPASKRALLTPTTGLGLGFETFGSKHHKMSKNRNTLIILRTYIVPKIAQKANIKKREFSLSDCSVGS